MTTSADHDPGSDGPEHGRERPAVFRSLLRRGTKAEERLAELIEAHRRDLDEQRARFEQTIEDLERREQLLSDAKASVERLLRLGSKDLDAKEADVARLIAELTEREERLRGEEAELARRRGEAGAVELKRRLVEQRERALEEREASIAAREASVVPESDAAPPTVAFVPGVVYRLVELEGGDLDPDRTLVVDDERYDVARIGPSPLPGDRRRCAYLVRGPRGPASPGGST